MKSQLRALVDDVLLRKFKAAAAMNGVKANDAIAEAIALWTKKNKDGLLPEKTDIEKDCDTFKKAVVAAGRTGRNASFRYMVTRKADLARWPEDHIHKVVSELKTRGEISVTKGRDGVAVYAMQNPTW